MSESGQPPQPQSHNFTIQVSDPNLSPQVVAAVEAAIKKAAAEALASFGMARNLTTSELQTPQEVFIPTNLQTHGMMMSGD